MWGGKQGKKKKLAFLRSLKISVKKKQHITAHSFSLQCKVFLLFLEIPKANKRKTKMEDFKKKKKAMYKYLKHTLILSRQTMKKNQL